MDRAAISELAKAKEAYVKELVSADKSLVMRYIAKKVEEKFGKALAPPQVARGVSRSGWRYPTARRKTWKENARGSRNEQDYCL
jgi:hypothetical protein